MRKLVLYIIGTFTSFIGAVFFMAITDPTRTVKGFEYRDWAPIYGLLIVAILFAILLILHARREPTPTKRCRVRAKSAAPRASWITGKPPSDEWSLD
jgi:hypothetical protein